MKTAFIFGFLLALAASISALSSPQPSPSRSSTSSHQFGNVLILDHLNINHEKGRHDWVNAFYFKFLRCIPDPRKAENLAKGRKTLWANVGAHQFHLPEGTPDAQLLEGVVTLVFSDMAKIQARLDDAKKNLEGSKFDVKANDNEAMLVVDPWGNQFRLVLGTEDELDDRGVQDGGPSEGLGIRDLTIYTPPNANMQGIARFYEQLMDCPILNTSPESCCVSVGPKQTLTFEWHPEANAVVQHEDLRNDQVEPPEGFPSFLSNYGPHVSMYVSDFESTYKRMDALMLAYVNPRFSRRAYNLDQALDDCMFRCLVIVDPENIEQGPILKLEHEIRSCIKPNGSKYKSCPFDKIPEQVVRYDKD
jgi:hypothetical protein